MNPNVPYAHPVKCLGRCRRTFWEHPGGVLHGVMVEGRVVGWICEGCWSVGSKEREVEHEQRFQVRVVQVETPGILVQAATLRALRVE